MSYRIWGNIKYLFHFDYPYRFERGDGLLDEVSGASNIFSLNGAKLAGNLSAEEIIASSVGPKFGYRCLHGSLGHGIKSENVALLNLVKSGNCEIEFFVNFQNLYDDGFLFRLVDNTALQVFSLNKSNEKIIFMGQGSNYNLTSANYNTWQHFKIRFSGGQASLIVNGTAKSSVELPSLASCTVLYIADCDCYMDELVFRQGVSDNSFPTVAYQGIVNVNDLGGFGKGDRGDIVISKSDVINNYALINSASSSSMNIGSWSSSSLWTPKVGDEVMLHVTAMKNSNESLLGLYAFKRIKSVSGSTYTFEETVSEFNLPEAVKNYYVQAITMPNFNTLTLNENCQLTPLAYDVSKHYGGIVAFRTKGNTTIKGWILSMARGVARTDLLQMTHGALIDRFMINSGGGIFISCGGILTANTAKARIGAEWAGNTGPGKGIVKGHGQNGGSGYGGGGGGDDDSNTKGGDAGVGGGGGAIDGWPSQPGQTFYADAGNNSDTGGNGGGSNDTTFNATYRGGTQGVTAGAQGGSVRGGGGAFGNGGAVANGTTNYGRAGASVIILAKTINIDDACLSTGGQGGVGRSYNPEGGGGTGLCYIACQNVR